MNPWNEEEINRISRISDTQERNLGIKTLLLNDSLKQLAQVGRKYPDDFLYTLGFDLFEEVMDALKLYENIPSCILDAINHGSYLANCRDTESDMNAAELAGIVPQAITALEEVRKLTGYKPPTK